MTLNFNVHPVSEVVVGEVTHQAFLFKPTELIISIGAINGNGMRDVQTDLIQHLASGGKITETRQHQFPVAVLEQVFNGYDVDTLQPTINEAAIGVILSQFDLALTP